MIRTFNLRDLALVRRLSRRGVSLHTEPALIDSVNPLRGALLSIVGGDFPTYVWKGEDGEAGFVQLYLEKDDHHAHILCLGATEDEVDASPASETSGGSINENVWLPLLDQAVVDVGRRGIHSLVAEVGEADDELSVLRRAGFAVYTRQDIWVARGIESSGRCILTPRRSADDWELQLLYANTVPRLVQLVEPAPTPDAVDAGELWMLREDGELTAFVHLHAGSVATWMRLFIHPNAEAQAEEIVSAAAEVALRKVQGLVYCCVRRYQSWLQGPMERAGFQLWGSQAVMVKHTVHHLQKPVTPKAALDAQHVSVSAPIVQRYRSPRRRETLGRFPSPRNGS